MLHVTLWEYKIMRSNVSERVEKHRQHLRESGLRPLQIWIPDTHREGFAKECRRQSNIIKSDIQEKEILKIISADFDDRGWE